MAILVFMAEAFSKRGSTSSNFGRHFLSLPHLPTFLLLVIMVMKGLNCEFFDEILLGTFSIQSSNALLTHHWLTFEIGLFLAKVVLYFVDERFLFSISTLLMILETREPSSDENAKLRLPSSAPIVIKWSWWYCSQKLSRSTPIVRDTGEYEKSDRYGNENPPSKGMVMRSSSHSCLLDMDVPPQDISPEQSWFRQDRVAIGQLYNYKGYRSKAK
jgi:hypothetical protein